MSRGPEMKIPGFRELRTVILLAVVAGGMSAIAFGADENIRSPKFSLYYVTGETKGSHESYIVEGEPPLVKDVITVPANPGVDDTVTIEARIENNQMMTQSNPIEATLFYSKDDFKTWNEVDMDEDKELEGLWRAEIPPAGEPGEIRYFITAVDDSGNVLLELPEVPIEWGGVDPPALTGAVADKNDNPRLVAGDIDILGAKAGFDGEMLYFAIRVEGRISSGTVSPFNVFVYSVGIYYPDLLDDGSVKTDLVLMHSQHAQFMRFPVIGLLNIDRDLAEIPGADARYYSNNDWLYMMFRAGTLKKARFDRLRIIFGTAYGSEYQPEVVLKPADTTMFINLVRSDRFYEVK